MDPLTMALLFGGAGLAKGLFIDQPRARARDVLRAEEQRMSPWTNMPVSSELNSDPIGQMFAGAAQGAQFGLTNQVRLADGSPASAAKVASPEVDLDFMRGSGAQDMGPPQYRLLNKSLYG